MMDGMTDKLRWWRWYLRGTWTLIRTGAGGSLVLRDLAAGLRWRGRP